MKLLPDWKRIARKSWSLRLALASAGLSAAEMALPYVAPAAPSGKFAALSFAVGLAAAVARIVAQPRMRDDD